MGGKPGHREYLQCDVNEESIKILRLGTDRTVKLQNIAGANRNRIYRVKVC